MKHSLIIFLVILSGCAAPEKWARSNTSIDEYSKDEADCNARMWSIPNGNALQMVMFELQCMRSKGYQKVPVKN
jgi:hypothetical protein